jgi:LPXTG-motif cell wall-anchored protein
LDGETVTLLSALGVGAILSGAGLFIARRRASR